jgi:hypothetical protein
MVIRLLAGQSNGFNLVVFGRAFAVNPSRLPARPYDRVSVVDGHTIRRGSPGWS